MTIRRLRFLASSCAVFSLMACVSGEPRTALDGQSVADRLNALYANTVDDCAGQPAYLCSGVPVRVFDPFNGGLPPLDPTPTQIDRDGASFSFIRKDLGIRHLYQMGWAGYAVAMQEKPGFVALKARCAFPVDAYTDSRPDSCGRSRLDTTPTLKSRPCFEQGVTSPQAWRSHFASLPQDPFSCSFDVSAQGFVLSMAARAFIPDDSYRHDQWNELIIAIWKQEDVPRLPVEAMFFYPNELIAFWRVQRYQCQLYFATGRPVPLLKLDLAGGADAVFSFDPADQIDFDAATPACEYAPAPSVLR